MNIDKDVLSYGQYLKSMRLEKGVSLDEISRETRIGKDILLSLEREDDGALPAEVFVKGFLRAYAAVIGIDGQLAVDKYLSQRQSVQETATSQKLFVQPRRRLWPLLLTAFIALGLLVFFSIYLTTEPRSTQPDETNRISSGREAGAKGPSPQHTTGESVVETTPEKDTVIQPPEAKIPINDDGKSLPAPEEKNEAAVSGKAESPPVPDPQKLTLAIDAKDETWMKIIVDGGKPKEYTLNAGDRLDLEGRAAFNLIIGNAGGVDLRFNGQPVEVPGKSGQVITLQFP